MATPLQIGGLINLEERSGSFLPKLPYTNRGVIRQKEELSALIDWCQITIKEVPLEAVIEDVLRIPLELMTVTGYEKGIAGHEVVAIFDNIKVLKPTGNAQYQGFQILMSGKGCRNYENFLQLNEETWFDFLNRVCQYHINVPRIDLAIDDRKPYPHAIRHTFCSRCFEKGMDAKVVQMLMGHQHYSTTIDIYTHVTETKFEEEIAKFGSVSEKQKVQKNKNSTQCA